MILQCPKFIICGLNTNFNIQSTTIKCVCMCLPVKVCVCTRLSIFLILSNPHFKIKTFVVDLAVRLTAVLIAFTCFNNEILCKLPIIHQYQMLSAWNGWDSIEICSLLVKRHKNSYWDLSERERDEFVLCVFALFCLSWRFSSNWCYKFTSTLFNVFIRHDLSSLE